MQSGHLVLGTKKTFRWGTVLGNCTIDGLHVWIQSTFLPITDTLIITHYYKNKMCRTENWIIQYSDRFIPPIHDLWQMDTARVHCSSHRKHFQLFMTSHDFCALKRPSIHKGLTYLSSSHWNLQLGGNAAYFGYLNSRFATFQNRCTPSGFCAMNWF